MPVHRRNLAVLCVTIFLSSASWGQIAPFLPQFLRELGVTHSLTLWSGVTFAVQPLAAIVMYPFWGYLGDRMGRKTMVVRAGLCISAIYLGMSICRTAWQLALLRLANGALSGFVPGSMALIATNTPDELAGRYVATAQSSSAAGAILGPVVGGLLALAAGRRGSMRLSSLVVLAATILVILLVREQPRQVSQAHASAFSGLLRVAARPPMPLVLWVSLLSAAVSSATQPILTLHLETLPGHRPEWMNGAVYALPGLALALSAHAWSRAGERRNRSAILGLAFAGMAVCLLAVSFTRSFPLFALGYLVYGGFLAAISPNLAAYVTEEVPADVRGSAYGLMQGASPAGAFVAPLAAGVIAKAVGLQGVFAVFGGVAAAGVLVVYGRLRRTPPPRTGETAQFPP